MTVIAIISGMQAEIDAFAPGLGETSDHHGLAVRRLDWHGKTVVLASAGIGKVHAALATTAIAIGFRPGLVLALGTAGSLNASDGAPRWLTGAVQHDYGAARHDGFVTYAAGTLPLGSASAPPFAGLAQPAGLGLAEAIIASGDCFVEAPELAARVRGDHGACLIDMETAAIAQAATLLGLPWAGIKAASDDANAASAETFEANFLATARRAAAAAERAVALLGRA